MKFRNSATTAIFTPMITDLERLYLISKKPVRKIIGLMSGTSLDGLDVALCEVSGSGSKAQVTVAHFESIPYTNDFKTEVRSVFSKKNIDLEKLVLLHPWIALQHAEIINTCLKKWNIKNSDVDLVASHGQTIYHAPKSLHGQNKFGNATLQIGDGDHLAATTGIICISDFRQKHIAVGGEGAPLAVYGDYLVFGKAGEDRILLNIGGIANFTYLPASMNTANIFSTDTGPGNTMMDSFIQQNFPGKFYDENAAIASSGKVNEKLLEALKNNIFFNQPFPKTTGPELFNLEYLVNAQTISDTEHLNKEDIMATLNKFSADTIVDTIQKTVGEHTALSVFSSGGGMHNPLLMEHIRSQLRNCSFYTTTDLGIDPDAKEAVLFAILANECICGDHATLGMGNSGMPVVSMGKISFPN